MTMQKSPFLGVNYGWEVGEDNWNVGMDDNLLKVSALLYQSVDGIGSTVPALNDGQIYFNTSDNTINYNVNAVVYSVGVPVGYSFSDKNTGINYTLTPTGLTQSFDQGVADNRYLKQSEATTYSKTLLAAATAAAARGVLGLGTASTQATGYFEPAITAGTTSQYLRGDKTFQDFATDVRASVLTGFTTAATAVTATDTVLSAFGKLQGQMNLKATLASPALSGTPTAPTAAAGTSTTQIATTAFVSNAVGGSGNYVSKGGDTMTGRLLTPSIRNVLYIDSATNQQTVGGTIPVSIDVTSYPIQQLNVTGAGTLTLTPSNLPSVAALDSVTLVIRIAQAAQPATISWWSGISWLTPSGAVPSSPTAGKISEYILTYYSVSILGSNQWVGRVGATT